MLPSHKITEIIVYHIYDNGIITYLIVDAHLELTIITIITTYKTMGLSSTLE